MCKHDCFIKAEGIIPIFIKVLKYHGIVLSIVFLMARVQIHGRAIPRNRQDKGILLLPVTIWDEDMENTIAVRPTVSVWPSGCQDVPYVIDIKLFLLWPSAGNMDNTIAVRPIVLLPIKLQDAHHIISIKILVLWPSAF
mmetsp:Transcript_14967/g.27727  ORF Transcript_14967/g.27727 Transcript_14967/m.27727 type:complete len:139 (+) Transcript_14967:350-766(+)